MRNAQYDNVNWMGTAEWMAISYIDDVASYLRRTADKLVRISTRAVNTLQYEDNRIELETWLKQYAGEADDIVNNINKDVEEIINRIDDFRI